MFVFIILILLKAGLYDEILLSRPLFWKKSVEIFQEAKCVLWNIIEFVQTIKFHSYDHNVSFIKLTIFVFLVIDITFLNHVWKHWKNAHNYVFSDWGAIANNIRPISPN